MSNEAYLKVSYFAVIGLCLGIALASYAWLRKSVAGITDSLPQENWKKIIRKAFPPSIMLFVLSSCLSVDYYGCGQKKYDEIVNDRSYITKKNTVQVSKALQGTIWSVGLWSVILAVALRSRRQRGPT